MTNTINNEEKLRITEQEWYIGIDFGTTNTFVVAYEKKTNRIYMSLSNVDVDKNGLVDNLNNIPTVITAYKDVREKENRFYIGQKANESPMLLKFRGLKTAARELTPPNGLFGGADKPRCYPFIHCEMNTKLQFGNEDDSVECMVQDLLKEFFKKLLHIGKRHRIDPSGNEKFVSYIAKKTVKKIIIGIPVEMAQGKKREEYSMTLKKIIADCFGVSPKNYRFIGTKSNPESGIVECIPEPILAGTTYLHGKGDDSKEESVLVIDIGGGTTDFSFLQSKNKKDGRPTAEKLGRSEIAGNDIDDLIYSLLQQNTERSKVDCRTCKESLFSDEIWGCAEPRVALSNQQCWVYYKEPASKPKYSYIVLEDELKKHIFNKIGEDLKSALQKWNEKNDKSIDKIFFVGGTSRIGPLRDALRSVVESVMNKKFNDKDIVTTTNQTIGVKLDDSGPINVTTFNAVAIGACIKAIGKKIEREPNLKYYDKENKIWQDIPTNTNESNFQFTETDEYLRLIKHIKLNNFHMKLLCDVDFSLRVKSETEEGYVTIKRTDYMIVRDRIRNEIKNVLIFFYLKDESLYYQAWLVYEDEKQEKHGEPICNITKLD